MTDLNIGNRRRSARDRRSSPEQAGPIPPQLNRRSAQGTADPERRRTWRRPSIPWALLPVLGAQAALSLHLVWSNTGFQDEALYLWAGHLEIAHWLHGAVIPAFPTYFSGAPVLYPPIGAVADNLGGMAGARILSLLFMLAATSFLWGAAARLFGARAAFFACALFAVLGVTQRLGAFATFDAMSLCLLALSVWCAVHSGDSEKSHGWLAAAAVALTAANSTKYASILFDPVVLGLVSVLSLRALGPKRALARGMTLMAYTAGFLVFLYSFGGGEYGTGIVQTTFSRAPGTDLVSAVLLESWRLTAVVVVLAAIGCAFAVLSDPDLRNRLLVALLAVTALLIPLQQARIRTTTSLDKHLDFGIWFAAIAAGYLIDRAIRLIRVGAPRQLVTGACVLLLALPLRVGIYQGKALFSSWPNSAALVTTLSRVLSPQGGPILAEHPSLPEYYLAEGRMWNRWSSTRSIRLADGKSISAGVGGSIDTAAYTSRIKRGFFSAVILDFGATRSADRTIVAALETNSHYHLVADVPYGTEGAEIWQYRPRSNFVPTPTGTRLAPVPLYQGVLTPVARPSPVLGPIVRSVITTGIVTLILMILIRCTWRRKKASDEA